MPTEDRLQDAVSWAVQLRLAGEAAAYAQWWKPQMFPDRVEELRWTRGQFERARQLAIAEGLLAPDAAIHIERHGSRDSLVSHTG